MAERAEGTMAATITAKVIRADGTEESLGVVSVSQTEAEHLESFIRKAKKAHGLDDTSGARPMTLDEVNELHAQESDRNDRASEDARQPVTED